MLGAPLYLSEDGGRTFATKERGIHTDFHAFWIDPANSDHVMAGSDGGITVSWDSGRTWDYVNNFPLGQFYEVTYDFQHPYHVCGGLQDNFTWCGPSATLTSRGPDNGDWIQITGGDGFHARIDPRDPDIVYSESQDGNVQRRVLSTGVMKSIRPQEDSITAPRYRFQWNSPLIISAFDNRTIYYGGNYLFQSTDRGDTWERLGNKDLTNNEDRNTMPILGKVVGKDTLSRNDGVVSWPCITAIAESPVRPGILWAGTDDGNLQVSRDGGKTWTNVAGKVPGLKGAQKDAYVSRIEASHKEEGTAYVAFDNHRSADYSVYIYMTRDFGNSWTRITEGIPQEAGTVHVVREDPVNPNLLFAGTEFGLYVTFNRGGRWEKMTNGLPTVPVFDLQIHPREHDLILATHGRSIYIMDNITPLEEMSDAVLTSGLTLFTPLPGTEWRTANYRGFTGSREFIGQNPAAGVMVDYYASTGGPARITVKDAAGKTVRSINSRAQSGVVNRVAWDLRTDNPLPSAFGGRGAAGGGGRGGRGGQAAERLLGPPAKTPGRRPRRRRRRPWLRRPRRSGHGSRSGAVHHHGGTGRKDREQDSGGCGRSARAALRRSAREAQSSRRPADLAGQRSHAGAQQNRRHADRADEPYRRLETPECARCAGERQDRSQPILGAGEESGDPDIRSRAQR